MAKSKIPVTPAIRLLRQQKVPFIGHCYPYEEHGGTAVCARELQVDEHAVIKTLILEDEHQAPLVMLMHGDRQVSTKKLARALGVKQIAPCLPETAQKHSGYQVGGTSPLGTRKAMPVYIERSILQLPTIYLNGGKRGFLVEVSPDDICRLLSPVPVDAATDSGD
ncbi:MAG: Cys-tRNA(Pro) deacylase [Syntrophotaleaceae bacterium]